MKKIRLIELFAGVGSQACALKRLGVDFEHYRVIEFDKYPIASYNAIHGTDFKPTSITDIKGEDLGIVDTEYFTYLLTYSFPCFVGDTLVLTKEGFKRLDEIIVGDQVLTHTNTYKKVLAVKQTGVKKTYSIKGMGIDEIKCTENHKFYVRKMSRHYPTINGKRTKIRKFSEPQWIECKELTKKYYLGIAINQNAIIPTWDGVEFTWSDGRKPRHKNNLNQYMNNVDFWWFVGRYVGDGWHRKQGGIIICCDKSELHEITDVADRLGFNYSVVEESTVMKIHFADKELEQFVEPFGRGAENKQIAGFMFDMPIELLKGFLDGYVSADGCYKDGLYRTSSVSRALSYGIAQIVAKVYKTPYRIYKNNVPNTTIIEGREVNQKPFYTVAWKIDKRKQDKAFFEDGYVWFPIQSISEGVIESVYDIETEIDHSFTANGVIVHNCQDLSVAGKQRGMTKGSGTRSGLLWEVERLLTETKELPQVLLMENVPQVHGKKNLADFEKWINFLESKGYKNFWKDLNAKDYGVAQNRNRTFMISFLDDVNYNFPEPIPLTKRMKDYLEDVVDERYYINNQKAEELINKLIINGEIDRQTDRQ